MIRIKPHVRSEGSGSNVVLLHSSGSSGKQWEALGAALGDRFRTHAVDLHGHARTAAWPLERRMRLEDDLALIEPLIHAPGGVHLVGHSYGGALALKAAALHPDRILSVSVYEPVLFRLLFDYHPRDRATTEVTIAAASIRNWLELGDAHRSAQRFVDFWSGDGSWRELPGAHQDVIASRMPAVMAHFHALFNDTMDMATVSQLQMPVLCMRGGQTRAPTRRLGELLRVALPRARHLTFAGMGHMGPLTHAHEVGRQIEAFLDGQVERGAQRGQMLQAA